MKQILTIIIGVLFTVTAYADCGSSGLSVFPRGKVIQQNSIFIVEGYSSSQAVILGLNKEHDIYLKSDGKIIRLIVTDICVGDFHLTQAILKPETDLQAGRTYTMYIDNLPAYERLVKYDDVTYKTETATYQVAASKDTEKPQVFTKPKEIKKTLVHYGCGPSIHVVFDNPAGDKTEMMVKTSVKNLKTGRETTYFITPRQDRISVGHGMCDGAFDFEDGDHYEVKFSFMDASGNIAEWIGEGIRFTKPTKETMEDGE